MCVSVSVCVCEREREREMGVGGMEGGERKRGWGCGKRREMELHYLAGRMAMTSFDGRLSLSVPQERHGPVSPFSA